LCAPPMHALGMACRRRGVPGALCALSGLCVLCVLLLLDLAAHVDRCGASDAFLGGIRPHVGGAAESSWTVLLRAGVFRGGGRRAARRLDGRRRR